MIAVFDVVIIALLYVDTKKSKSLFTPFTITAAIFLMLININNFLISKIYHYDKVENKTLILFLIVFSIIFVVRCVMYQIFDRCSDKEKAAEKISRRNRLIPILFYIGLIAYFISMILSLKQYGFGQIKGTNNGIFGHLSSFGYIMAPLLVSYYGQSKKKLIAYISVALHYGIGLMFGGKYPLFINAMYFILYFVVDKKIKFKQIIKYLLLVAILVVLVFVVIYTILPSIFSKFGGTIEMMKLGDTIEHLFYYLLAPVIACNDAFSSLNPNGTQIVFTVPINIYRFLIGNNKYVSPIHGFDYGYASNKSTNVAGLFGETINCLGPVWGTVFIVILFVFIYYVYLMYRKKDRYKLLTCLLLSACCFSFFFNFFTVSGVMIPMLFAVAIELILTRIGNNDIKRKTNIN